MNIYPYNLNLEPELTVTVGITIEKKEMIKKQNAYLIGKLSEIFF